MTKAALGVKDLYPYNSKELALLTGMSKNTIATKIREGSPIYGVKVRFERSTKIQGSPYRISKESFLAIQRRVLKA